VLRETNASFAMAISRARLVRGQHECPDHTHGASDNASVTATRRTSELQQTIGQTNANTKHRVAAKQCPGNRGQGCRSHPQHSNTRAKAIDNAAIRVHNGHLVSETSTSDPPGLEKRDHQDQHCRPSGAYVRPRSTASAPETQPAQQAADTARPAILDQARRARTTRRTSPALTRRCSSFSTDTQRAAHSGKKLTALLRCCPCS
jgi:FtsZ-interacting cell division protein ZipA